MGDDFGSKYTNANLVVGAPAYDSELLAKCVSKLEGFTSSSTQGTRLSYGILTAILCAQKRGDAVGALFHQVTTDKSESEVKDIFAVLREAVTLVAPFVGLPNCMPASFGLVAELKKRQIEEVPLVKPRPGYQDLDYGQKGYETYKAVYRGVGNPEVGQIVAKYLPELLIYAHTSIFGYLLGGSTLLPLQEAEIIVASSIIGLGASRQARSHCKAAIQLGNAPALLQTVDEIANEIASWNRTPLPRRLDVPTLVKELEVELGKGA